MAPGIPHPSSTRVYRPDVDGLRALAVLFVVFYHAFPAWMPGGFVGVDIFFVLSGHLITGILLSDLDRGTFSIAGFYARRVRRIFPALLATLAATLLVGWALQLPDEFRRLGRHLLGGSTFSSNLLLWSESGYFDTSAETKPLLHLWSLAIEEQYYLGWPLLLAALWRLRRHALALNALVLAVSFASNVYLVRHDPTAAYYMPLSRFWELLAGALLAQLHHRGVRFSPAGGGIAAPVGAVLLGMGLLWIDKWSAFPGWWALLPVFGTFLLLAAGEGAWLNRHLLSNRLLVGIGLVSYPLYLWHWPILSFLRINYGEAPFPALRWAGIGLSLVLAWATYRWIERPLRFHRSPRTVPLLLGGLVLVAGAGAALLAAAVSPRHHGPEIDRILEATDEWSFPGKLQPVPGEANLHAFPTRRKETTLYLGDSHMEQYAGRIAQVAAAHLDSADGVRFATKGGCPPLPGVQRESDPECGAAVERAFQRARDPDVRRIVVGGCWNCFLAPPEEGADPGTEYHIEAEGIRHPLNRPEGLDVALANLERTLRALPPDKRVFLLLDNPKGLAYDPEARMRGHRLVDFRIAPALDSVEIDAGEVHLRNRLFDFARRLGIEILDPHSMQCSDRRCLSTLPDGTPVYSDDHHYRAFFVEERAAFLDRTLLPR